MLLFTASTSLKQGVKETISPFLTHGAMRENLDTERITFTMFDLWLGTIACDTIVKLNGNF
jgi:hypothetical protein